MHPLHSFRYCPLCGSEHFIENNFKSKKCERCGFVYYFNSAAATAIFITNNAGELLVVRRAKEPAKGSLDLPGGFVDLDETAEEAIIREVKEETGLQISTPLYLFSLPNIYRYSGFDVHTIDMFFRYSVNTFSGLQAGDDAESLFFLKKNEIQPEMFGLNSIRRAVEIRLTEH
ncbi:MAG: NUDIX domain-containing protein [Candidatus Azobacteroides sp.]|nr:NUDIX domain-containing protein [Candidatus Azobacteroides sp.]